MNVPSVKVIKPLMSLPIESGLMSNCLLLKKKFSYFF